MGKGQWVFEWKSVGEKSLGVRKVGTHFGRIVDPESGNKVRWLRLFVALYVGCCFISLFFLAFCFFFLFCLGFFSPKGSGRVVRCSKRTGGDEQARHSTGSPTRGIVIRRVEIEISTRRLSKYHFYVVLSAYLRVASAPIFDIPTKKKCTSM